MLLSMTVRSASSHVRRSCIKILHDSVSYEDCLLVLVLKDIFSFLVERNQAACFPIEEFFESVWTDILVSLHQLIVKAKLCLLCVVTFMPMLFFLSVMTFRSCNSFPVFYHCFCLCRSKLHVYFDPGHYFKELFMTQIFSNVSYKTILL